MADEEVATRAPESDAAASEIQPESKTTTESSSVPQGENSAQTGPSMSMSEHCTTDRPTPAGSATPIGELSTLNDIPCYIVKPKSYPQEPCKLMLLLTGGTGLHSTNNQLQADAYAARGFVVVMPDQFQGDAAPKIGVLSDDEAIQAAAAEQGSSPGDGASLLERIKLGVAETAKSFLIDMWLARHTPEKVLPICHKVLDGARELFADSVANGNGVYGVGYCFGAKYVMLLCGTQPEAGAVAKEPELRAGAIAHGTLVTKEDIEGVRSPTSMACVAGDNLFPDDVREQGRASLELNAVEHEIEVFHDVPHGFAVLGDYAEQKIREKQGEAFEMMCAWLESH